MKSTVAIILILFTLTGCTKDDYLKQAMELRKSVLASDSCAFSAVVTADYTDELYTFQMDCLVDANGELTFTVTDPETIAGITGSISGKQAALTFDDKILAFPMLADGQITPVGAPWIFMNTLKSGYISACSREDEGFCLYMDDSYGENPLRLHIYTDSKMQPLHADIYWEQRCILSADIRDFIIR